MARTINEIQAEIIGDVQADANLASLSSTSGTAIWRLITRVVARAMATEETLWDVFKAEIEALIATKKPHTSRWYQAKSLAFQLGDTLVDGEDYYDNTGVSPDDIEDAQIVAQAAVTDADGMLTVKVAKLQGSSLTKLSTEEYDAFDAYIQSIKDAGVNLTVLSFDADKLNIEIDIYYDPLVLNSSGARLDGTNNSPVRTAITSHLLNLPFNGVFIKAHLTDTVQAVEGVVVPEIRTCRAGRFDSASQVSVDIQYQPYSGFLKLDSTGDLIVNYIPYV